MPLSTFFPFGDKHTIARFGRISPTKIWQVFFNDDTEDDDENDVGIDGSAAWALSL